MSSHDNSGNRTPATYRTTRPTTYRTTNRTTNPATDPPTAVAGPSVHSTTHPHATLPHVVATAPATPSQTRRNPLPAPHHDDRCTAVPTHRWPGEARRTVPVRHVDSDCLIGVRHPHQPGVVRARSVDAGGHPRVMLPVLRRLWTVAGHDSTRLAARLLTHDWCYLDPAIPDTAVLPAPVADPADVPVRDHGNGRSLPGITGRRVIAGVGITHPATGPDATTDSEPVVVVPLAHLGLLDTAWLYLIDPASDSVTVHTGDGGLVSHHHFLLNA